MAYLLDHPNIVGWKKCPGCGYSEDSEGYNLLNPKPKDEYGDLEERNIDGKRSGSTSQCGSN